MCIMYKKTQLVIKICDLLREKEPSNLRFQPGFDIPNLV